MLDFLHHLFLPRESNNHRAKLLHIQPLFFLVSLLLVMHLLTPVIERTYPDVLGITANVSVEELLNLTNQQRITAGLNPLSLDTQLSAAAQNKASDMLIKNYWAHNAPDGTTPWVFIKAAGYDYLYAGENLARGFTTANDAVNAWMASLGHRENILSPKYNEVGFAVVTGNLTGDETVLIVEMFGNRFGSTAVVGSAQNTAVFASPTPALLVFSTPVPTAIQIQPTFIAQAQILPTSTLIPTVILSPTSAVALPNNSSPEQANPFFIASVRREPLINKDFFSRNLSLIITALFIILFAVDLIIIERKKIIRLVAHNTDHMIFLAVIFITLLIYARGLVL